MKSFKWNTEKNQLLAKERGITFEEIVQGIEAGNKVVEVDHPDQKRYPGQKIMIVDMQGYAYLVPFVFDGQGDIFLKQLSRAERRPKNIWEGWMSEDNKKMNLDGYESEILEAYEQGRLSPSYSQTDFQAVARNTMKKTRKINIRISENDLNALQRKAAREGIPYQTLIGSVLHKYVSGFLKESSE